MKVRLLLALGALLLVAAPAYGDSATHQSSAMFLWNTTTAVPGSQVTLTRSENSVAMTINSSGLTPGWAATVWWVVFNNPAACSTPCGVDDLNSPAVNPWMGLAAGHVIGEDGNANYGGGLREGDTRRSDGPGNLAQTGPGLLDSRAAEIHLVIRTHGPALAPPNEQIHSFGAGCNPGCFNVQSAAFLP
jgi:hypothetical protein